MSTRLAPDDWFPAGRDDVSARQVTLATGMVMRVLESGPPLGPPVLLLHGWAISAYLWRHNFAALAAAGYRVIAPDLPGHGRSSAPQEKGSYTLEAFTNHLESLLDTLQLERPLVVAQSMGGRVAVELARRNRAAALALFGPVGFGVISPAHEIAPFLPTIPGSFAAMLIPRELVELVQRRVYGKIGWFTERDVDEYWAPTQFPDVVRATLQMLREFQWAPLTPELIREITVPTLVVFGTADHTVTPANAEGLVKALPHGRLEWVEGGGHVVMEEVPDIVNTLLLDFLAEQRRPD